MTDTRLHSFLEAADAFRFCSYNFVRIVVKGIKEVVTSLAASPAQQRTTPMTVDISPAFAGLEPPLIVTGMHRSGTSMVVGMLQVLGVYMDPDLEPITISHRIPGDRERTDGYGEAVAFRLANEAVMRRTGADWQHVESFLDQRDGPNIAAASIRQLTTETHNSLKTGYLDRYPGGRPGTWGWKDPRNSLTLPYWLTLFPHARVLHVRRDIDSVVNSLMRRSAESAAIEAVTPPSVSERLRNAASNPTRFIRGVGRRVGLSKPVQPMTRQDWARLVERYTSENLKYRDHAPGYLEVSYEAILNDPESFACQLSAFAKAPATDSEIRVAAAFVDRRTRN